MFDSLHSTQRRDAALAESLDSGVGQSTARERVRAVVLAGVHSWGCSELEREVPRPMMPVAGRPLIGHALAWLRDGGVKSVAICANSDTPVLRRWLKGGDAFRLDVDYYEDVMPRGPAGCVLDAMESDDAELFLVVDGTVVPRLDLKELVADHLRSDAVLTVVAEPSGRPENNSSHLSPVGVYVCSRQVLKYIPAAGYQDIKETLLPRLYGAGERVATCVVEPGLVPRVSTLASYLAVSKWAVTHLVGADVRPVDYLVGGGAWIHRSAVVAESARIIGPVLVEAGSEIAEGAIVVGPTTIGPDCRIEAGAVVCRSVLWSDCIVEAGARLDHCVLSAGARVPAGVASRNRVCLAPPYRWGLGGDARSRWSRGSRLADDNVKSIGEGCEETIPPAISVPSDRLVGMPLSSGRTRRSSSRWTSPARVHTHGG